MSFSKLGRLHLPPGSALGSAVPVDVDGDNDIDLVCIDGSQMLWYANDGTGIYSVPSTQPMPPLPLGGGLDFALGDVDGDGDPDLVLATSGTSALWLNDGAGNFTDVTPSQLPSVSGSLESVALGDIDGDGDLDLFFGGSSTFSGDRLYLNDGAGTFADVSASQLPPGLAGLIRFADVDGDGDLDAVRIVPMFGFGIGLYLNDGSGAFTDVTTQQMPVFWETVHDLAMGDADGDGDLDVVVATSGQNKLLTNDGAGVFADVSATHMPPQYLNSRAMSVGDVDGDGDLDAVFGNFALPDSIYINDGNGAFTEESALRMPQLDLPTDTVALVDVDGDGTVDLVSSHPSLPSIFFNDGNGMFVDGQARRMPISPDLAQTNAVAVGDVNGDGAVDLVFASGGTSSSFSLQNRLLLNDGNQFFTDVTATNMPPLANQTTSIALGDVDGDGDSDLMCGVLGQANVLLLNDGSGVFTVAPSGQLPAAVYLTRDLQLGDVDGDGDLDLTTANGAGSLSQQNRLYLNDGSGNFTDATVQLPSILDATLGLELVDVDGDSDLDLIFADYLQRNRLCLNDGSGVFTDVTATQMPFETLSTLSVAVGDVDGDGSPDMVFGSSQFVAGSIYLNNGSGSFQLAPAVNLPSDLLNTNSVQLGDVDGDGDLDIMSATANAPGWPTYGAASNRLFLNEGNGVFLDASAMLPTEAAESWALVLRDIDADGDYDVVVGNKGDNVVYLNLLRQLHAPHILRPGMPCRLDVYSRGALSTPLDVAAAYLATTRQSIPTVFGTLGIVPLVGLPLVMIPQATGVGSVTWSVPNVPSLSGVAIYAQAMVVSQDLRLSNVTTEVVH